MPPPKGERWYPRTLRHTLTDLCMTGKNVKIFTVKNKRAKQHLDSVDLPDGTYPRILSDELYARVLERASVNAVQASRNSKYPEMFLLRAGFARCAYCKQTMMAKRIASHGDEWFAYAYPNRFGECTRFTVPAAKLDAAVWNVMEQLADHIAIIEKSIRLAMENRSLNEDLQATEAALGDWKAKVENYEGDLQDSGLRGTTRAGIRNLLDAAYAMVEELEKQHAELVMHSVDRDKVHAEYEKVLDWCKQVESEREELTYTQKRDFLYILGATVLVYRQEWQGAPPTWDIRVALPKVQEIIYQGNEGAFGDSLSRGRSELAFLQHFSWRTW